jgi:hypothetical protein
MLPGLHQSREEAMPSLRRAFHDKGSSNAPIASHTDAIERSKDDEGDHASRAGTTDHGGGKAAQNIDRGLPKHPPGTSVKKSACATLCIHSALCDVHAVHRRGVIAHASDFRQLQHARSSRQNDFPRRRCQRRALEVHGRVFRAPTRRRSSLGLLLGKLSTLVATI